MMIWTLGRRIRGGCFRFAKRVAFFCVLGAALPVLFAGETRSKNDAAPSSIYVKIIERAKQIEPMLGDGPRWIGMTIENRALWEEAAKLPIFKDTLASAKKIAAQPIPELSDESYTEFHRTGNRSNYQNTRTKKYGRLRFLVLGECLENKGTLLPAIIAQLESVCEDKSWTLPAHDRKKDIFEGRKNYVDLSSADTSLELSLALRLLEEKLPSSLRERLLAEIERRTFVPFEKSLRAPKIDGNMWWMLTTNNWNAVCYAGVVGAALNAIESKERRALYIAAAEHGMNRFFQGFTPDGYCSEGMGYWNYGFGHFVDLAEILYRETDGQIDLIQRPEIENVTLFGVRMEMMPGLFAAFADCSIAARPSPTILGYMSRRLGLGLADYEKQGVYPNVGVGNLKTTLLYCFPNTASKQPPAAPREMFAIRSEFPDAGITICRPNDWKKGDLCLAFKGGHNAEHHNHNDIGAWTVARNQGLPLLDPGGEVYTRRTFSSERYVSNLLNSFGHPVPRIDGTLQSTGAKAKGVLLEKRLSEENDAFLFDIASAYEVKGKKLEKLTRAFTFYRDQGGKVRIVDSFKLDKPVLFETALVSYGPYQNETGRLESNSFTLTVGDAAKQQAVVATVSSDHDKTLVFETVEIDEDAMARKKPTRLGFRFKEPLTEGKITIVVVPAP